MQFGPRIPVEQARDEIALMNCLSFVHADFFNDAFDARAHVSVVDRQHVERPFDPQLRVEINQSHRCRSAKKSQPEQTLHYTSPALSRFWRGRFGRLRVLQAGILRRFWRFGRPGCPPILWLEQFCWRWRLARFEAIAIGRIHRVGIVGVNRCVR